MTEPGDWNPEEIALSRELADLLGKASSRGLQAEVLGWALAAWIADHRGADRQATAEVRERLFATINKMLRGMVAFYSQRPGYEQ